MVDSIKNINITNCNTCVPVKSINKNINNTCSIDNTISYSSQIPFTSNTHNPLRTECSSKKEKEQYNTLLNLVDKNTRKHLDILLKSGVLLNCESNDNSTVLENLYKIVTEPRAEGLDSVGLLTDTITTISYPYIVTQQFGDIPKQYRNYVLTKNYGDSTNILSKQKTQQEIDVDHSGTCVAASIEFNLAKNMPAEFARFAEGLSSQKMTVEKNIKIKNLADNPLDAVWLLNSFEIPYEMNNFDNAKLKFAPDKNAIVRAQIQTTDKDPLERSPLDVLMQSTFMQVGSQQTYNSITDKRAGKFNQNDKGLIEFEKTFTESVVTDKNRLSVTYQKVDDNRLVGYETSFDTMKKHLTTAIDRGENVIIGYTQTDRDNIIINGHEITIVGYRIANNGKMIFICNDTDDNLSKPIEYNEDYLLPKIHHAALPQDIVESDLTVVPNWVEGLNQYKILKQNIVNEAT